ncbi:multifunctional cyclase-dehydratase-3-O-methyl transferase TcmN [Peptococcaceae bacterium CEB3]|nr:multifunctional cyclase-dehydratase-3-O-methyl transferase TcmN [Peptococcaceae bacterium CEB3]
MTFHYNPQEAGPQYLEDLATGYWLSETLFTAVELEIFDKLDLSGKTVFELVNTLPVAQRGLERFLQALCALGLLTGNGTRYFNTKLASEYLVTGKNHYQGDSILWRKYLKTGWQHLAKSLAAGERTYYGPPEEDPELLARRVRKYIKAMDNVAQIKVIEILPFFEGLPLSGKILDVGAGSGAMAGGFLEHFPALTATLLDLPHVLDYTREIMDERGFGERLTYCPANILEPWPLAQEGFDLVILSNILHAYSQDEIPTVLERAARCLKPDGVILVHDFFSEHHPEKAGLFDLNMFIHTYNGIVFSETWVREELARQRLTTTELLPLTTDTAVIFAAQKIENLESLRLDAKALLQARIKTLGFKEVVLVPTMRIHVPNWADLRCQYGCDRYGKPHCPPNSPSPQKTREVLQDYTLAALLEGEPPARSFQRQVLLAEKQAFKAGFYKAFAYWAGPCALCETCSTEGICCNTRDARPSMEGAGIDVYETVRRAGLSLRTLSQQGDYVRYFALLLLE